MKNRISDYLPQPGDSDVISALDDIIQKTNAAATWRSRLLAVMTDIREGVKGYDSPEFIRALQAGRDANPGQADFWNGVIVLFITTNHDEGAAIYEQYADRFAAIRSKHGLAEGEDFTPGEEPEDFLALDNEFIDAVDAAIIDAFRSFGEDDLADMIAEDRDRVVAFVRRAFDMAKD
jgi:hypothetical protein